MALSDGENIALRRNRLGWKQRLLAANAGVSLATVLKIEKDRNVRVDMLRAVEAALTTGEAERGLDRPTLSSPTGTTEPSKEGADAAHTRQKMRLETLEVVLVEALEVVRRGLSEYADARDPQRKRG